jgi:hypothetical protein
MRPGDVGKAPEVWPPGLILGAICLVWFMPLLVK